MAENNEDEKWLSEIYQRTKVESPGEVLDEKILAQAKRETASSRQRFLRPIGVAATVMLVGWLAFHMQNEPINQPVNYAPRDSTQPITAGESVVVSALEQREVMEPEMMEPEMMEMEVTGARLQEADEVEQIAVTGARLQEADEVEQIAVTGARLQEAGKVEQIAVTGTRLQEADEVEQIAVTGARLQETGEVEQIAVTGTRLQEADEVEQVAVTGARLQETGEVEQIAVTGARLQEADEVERIAVKARQMPMEKMRAPNLMQEQKLLDGLSDCESQTTQAVARLDETLIEISEKAKQEIIEAAYRNEVFETVILDENVAEGLRELELKNVKPAYERLVETLQQCEE